MNLKVFQIAMDEKDGIFALKIARQTIELWVKSREKFRPEGYPKIFDEPRGVFVTIHTHPEKQLRGCIGFPEPGFPLIKALVEAAVASTHDPRFSPLQKEELDRIIVEVSVLTRPEPIKVKNSKEYPKKIKIGRDGLIVKRGYHSGLLLPQVATEHKLNKEDFLMHTCIKAGLPPDAWLEKDVEIFKFQSLIFSEKKPGKA
jgi:uncharacterized protein (TIGR00296 family)